MTRAKKPKKLKPPPFDLGEGEQVLMEKRGGSIRGPLLSSGTIFLTNQRIFIKPRVFWVFWLAPVVGLAMYLIGRGAKLDLPIADIAHHERAKFAANPNCVRIASRDGTERTIYVDDFVNFATTLSEQPDFTSKAFPA